MGTMTTHWRRSSHSGGNGGACIEVACYRSGSNVLVRDSKNGTGPMLRFTACVWRRFAAQVKASAS
jgi:hypothetical protein